MAKPIFGVPIINKKSAMKHYYAIALLLLSNGVFAQDSRLFANDWYLTDLIENGIGHTIPSNSESPNITLHFDAEFSGILTDVCNYMSGSVQYDDSNSSFLLTDYYFTLILCNSLENQNFEGVYFGFFSEHYPNDTFGYEITESGDSRTLTLTSSNGKQAIYSDHLLATRQFGSRGFSIEPNPAKSDISIRFGHLPGDNAVIEIYTALGKKCKTENAQSLQHTISVADLQAGMYIVRIQAGGEVFTQKFIKM